MTFRIILKLAPGQDAKSVTFESVSADDPHRWARKIADQMGLKLSKTGPGGNARFRSAASADL